MKVGRKLFGADSKTQKGNKAVDKTVAMGYCFLAFVLSVFQLGLEFDSFTVGRNKAL